MKDSGKICEVINGMKVGKFAKVPNGKQHPTLSVNGRLYVEYFEDEACELPVIEKGGPVCGITSVDRLRVIGFYD
jgi:hypothetical protein